MLTVAAEGYVLLMSEEPDILPDEPATTAQDYIDPYGKGPIPDPMPDDLQPDASVQAAYDEKDPMEGEAPSS